MTPSCVMKKDQMSAARIRGDETHSAFSFVTGCFLSSSCSSGRSSTTTPTRIPPSPARMRLWPSGGATSSRSSARRTTPGGRPVTRETAAVARDWSLRRSFTRGGRPPRQRGVFSRGSLNTFVCLCNRRVTLQRPKALFTPRGVKPPGDESDRQTLH